MMSKFKRVLAAPLRHPFITALVVVAGLGVVAYSVGAARPDPKIETIPMSWQNKATAGPVPNGGVDAKGMTLNQFSAGHDVNGQTKEAFILAGGAPDKWVECFTAECLKAWPKGKAEDWQPVPKYVFTVGEDMYVLRRLRFSNKLAEPAINRVLLCGEVMPTPQGAPAGYVAPVNPNGLVPYTLTSIPAPTRTDGVAVKNHPTKLAITLPAGVKALSCRYQAEAEFVKGPFQKVAVQFAPVDIVIVAAPTTTGNAVSPAKGKQ